MTCLLQAVKDTKELRDAVEEVQPERVKLSLRLGQSRALYDGFKVQKFMPFFEKHIGSYSCTPNT